MCWSANAVPSQLQSLVLSPLLPMAGHYQSPAKPSQAGLSSKGHCTHHQDPSQTKIHGEKCKRKAEWRTLARVTMSGVTPWVWNPQKWLPVRPKPVCTSSAMQSPPAFLTISYAAGKYPGASSTAPPTPCHTAFSLRSSIFLLQLIILPGSI